ncbi:MAG: aminoacyl-tRNA hydrolase [Bryobacteraceae bacterium]|nr:aminoacyl-tRNA hydrolase [Bryobacteraceae bacterium]MDW8376874.1 aminoacyl-tRNA hydrolase [Bryobacterales bacterium]
MFPQEVSWLIVGLGNPGPEYEHSPHNMGFLVVDRLAERHSIRLTRPDSQALTGFGQLAGQAVLLAKPLTYMNRSGGSVKQLVAKHQVPLSRTLLIYDELDLPWGSLRVRPKGSAAGHNGVKSVIASLGSMEFPRVRIGVHPGHPLASGTDFLLSAMNRTQRDELDGLLDFASQAVESIVAEGVEKAMAKFNRRARGVKEEEA